MPQTIRLTITGDLEKALDVLRKSTLGTLNTTELIKMAVGGYARSKQAELSPKEMDEISARIFYNWAREDGTLGVDNIADTAKLKPFKLQKHVPNR